MGWAHTIIHSGYGIIGAFRGCTTRFVVQQDLLYNIIYGLLYDMRFLGKVLSVYDNGQFNLSMYDKV